VRSTVDILDRIPALAQPGHVCLGGLSAVEALRSHVLDDEANAVGRLKGPPEGGQKEIDSFAEDRPADEQESHIRSGRQRRGFQAGPEDLGVDAQRNYASAGGVHQPVGSDRVSS
jgi:hypothetical protein